MKNIISAAIIATVALGSAASADVTKMGKVYRDGVAIGSIHDVKVMDGATPAQATAEVKAFYKEMEAKRIIEQRQERKAKIEFAKNNIVIPADLKGPAMDAVNEFVEANRAELEALAKDAGLDLDDSVAVINELIENGALSRDVYNANAEALGITETFEEAQEIAADLFEDARAALKAAADAEAEA